MDYNDISPEIRNVLGSTNAEIINNLVVDVIENSYGTEYIRLSDEEGSPQGNDTQKTTSIFISRKLSSGMKRMLQCH